MTCGVLHTRVHSRIHTDSDIIRVSDDSCLSVILLFVIPQSQIVNDKGNWKSRHDLEDVDDGVV